MPACLATYCIEPCPKTDLYIRSGYIFNLKDSSSGDILAQSERFTVVTQGSNTTALTVSSASTTASGTSTASATVYSNGSTSGTDADADAPTGGAGTGAVGGTVAAGLVAAGAVAGVMLVL